MRKFRFVAMICALILCIGSMSACASDTRTPLYVLHFLSLIHISEPTRP